MTGIEWLPQLYNNNSSSNTDERSDDNNNMKTENNSAGADSMSGSRHRLQYFRGLVRLGPVLHTVKP